VGVCPPSFPSRWSCWRRWDAVKARWARSACRSTAWARSTSTEDVTADTLISTVTAAAPAAIMQVMHTIYIDADSCPVKDEVYRVARRYAMAVKVVANTPLRVPADARIELVLRPGFSSADDWIAEQAGAGDIVITSDIPLAARCLAREARVLGPKVLAAHSDRDKNALCPGTGRGWWIAGLSHL
jgi:hypothetical protein